MTEASSKTAVLLLAHGTPDVLGEMAEYLSKVTGGRALPNEVVKPRRGFTTANSFLPNRKLS